MAKKKPKKHPRAITLNPDYIPCSIEDGNEYYPNGVFVFNITKLITYIDTHRGEFTTVDIDVAYYQNLQTRNQFKQDYVQQADLDRPVILAEIAPDRYEMGMNVNFANFYERGYNLIDGHHRVAKAHNYGIKTLKAYIVRMEQHINCLTEGYENYVQYWNDKLEMK